MAKYAIALKIDVSKIDKEKLYKGAKGTYLDAVAYINTEKESEYGDHGMITQSVSKKERESGVKGAILGNGKIVWREETGGNSAPAMPGVEEDDIPF